MELIAHICQGVADLLWVVQELNTVGIRIIFHRKRPLDMCCIDPEKKRVDIKDGNVGGLLKMVRDKEAMKGMLHKPALLSQDLGEQHSH